MPGPYAVRGALYVGSIADVDGADGTLLKGIEEGEIEIFPSISTIEKRNMDAQLNVVGTALADVAFSVILRFRGHDSDTIDRVMGWLASSGVVKTTNATNAAPAATTALIVRPANTSEKYFYSPAISLFRASGLRLLYSQTAPVLGDAAIEFKCGIAIGSPTEPAAMWDTAAAIASAYAGLS